MTAYISTGRGIVNLSEPDPAQISIDDIARSLSHQGRFTGHTDRHYSVAEHSVYCAMAAQSMCMSLSVQRQALMHDAHEAYIGDISRPVKDMLGPEITELEASMWRTVAIRFRLNPEIAAQVWDIDDQMLMTEVEHFHGGPLGSHWPDVKPFDRDVVSIRKECTPEEARKAFLMQVKRLEIF